jgi:hypothetical protein
MANEIEVIANTLNDRKIRELLKHRSETTTLGELANTRRSK